MTPATRARRSGKRRSAVHRNALTDLSFTGGFDIAGKIGRAKVLLSRRCAANGGKSLRRESIDRCRSAAHRNLSSDQYRMWESIAPPIKGTGGQRANRMKSLWNLEPNAGLARNPWFPGSACEPTAPGLCVTWLCLT